MRKPQRSKGNRVKVSRSRTLLAPVKGWYVGENITDSPPGTAYIADNVFFQYDYARVRRGSKPYATGLGSTVNTLMSYQAGTNVRMFAAAGSSIWDVSSGGPVGTAAVTGLTSTTFHYTQFGVTGGNYLVLTNGSDSVREYDGSAWSTPSITGVTSANLYGVWQHKSRLYFVENNTTKCWYLPVDSIAGAATVFNLGGIFPRGGSLLIGGTWAVNATSGLYELNVFISDQGDVAVYDGSYPGDAAWKLMGTYRVSKPLGRNCLMKAGGDLAIMTQDGIVPMSKVMELDQVALQNEAVTKPIAPVWRNLVVNRVGFSGWSITQWPLESMALITVPQTMTSDRQILVANMRSGAWSRYTGWDAQCMTVFSDGLYFGTSDGRVMQGETGGQDDGSLYTAVLVWSFSDLGVPSNRKQVKLIRPILQSSLTTSPSFQILADYDTTVGPPPAASTQLTTGFAWDTYGHGWDQDVWGGATNITRYAAWVATAGLGTMIAPVMQVSLSSANPPDVRMTQVDILFEPGEIIG